MYVLPGSAPQPSLQRWQTSLLVLTLCTLLLCYGTALWRGNITPVVFDYLYGQETAFGDHYQWAPPQMHLFVPLELVAPGVIVSHRLTAGPDAASARTLTITSAGMATQFKLFGGTPPRIYSYLLPTNGHVLEAEYTISALPQYENVEQRDLGFIIYRTPATTFRPVHSSIWPSLPLLAIGLSLPFSLLVMQLWGLRRYRGQVAGAIMAVLIAIYVLNPAAILLPSLAIIRSLLLLLLCGGIWRITLRRHSPYAMLLALCIAAVTVPLIYIGNSLWLNIGTQWYAQRPLLIMLLVIPLAVGLALAHPRSDRYVPWGAALAALSVSLFGTWNLWSELSAPPYDFTVYWEAAQRLRQGLPIYEIDQLIEAPFSGVYKYHPIFLFSILPFSTYLLEIDSLLWRAGNLAAIVISGVIALRVYRGKPLIPGAILAVLLLNLSPITQSLRLGQIDGLLLLGLVLILVVSQEEQPWLAGILWALMSIIKIYPVILVLPDLLKHRWRLMLIGGISIAGIVILSGTLFGWSQERTFWQEVVPSLGARTTRLSNQSLYGMIGRTLYPASADSDSQAVALPLASALHGLLAAFVLGSTYWAVWRQQRHQHTREAHLSAISALICAMLLVIPVSWDHYEALLALPLLGGCVIALRHEAQRPLLLGAYTLLAFGTSKQVQNGLIDSEVVLFIASYRTVGMLLLWGWWLWWLLKEAADIEPTVS